MFIRELQKSVNELKGVGTSTAAAYASSGILTWADLLQQTPRGYEDRSRTSPIIRAGSGGSGSEPYQVNTIITVVSHEFFGGASSGPGRRGRTLKVVVADESGAGSLLCFGRAFLQKKLVIGEQFYLFGTFQYKYGEYQCSLFEIEPYAPDQPPDQFSRILAIYPLAGDLTQHIVRRDITRVLRGTAKYLENEIPEAIMASQGVLDRQRALFGLHQPSSLEEAEEARRSLAFEELFYLQLIVRRRALRRQAQQATWHTKALKRTPGSGPSVPTGPHPVERLIELLPFRLTADQVTVLEEIRRDLSQEHPMARLLQGDVGSGKTVTAFLSALEITMHGGQVAFMAPTELLARQHAENAVSLLAPLGVRIAFLTGGVRGQERRHLLKALAHGEIDILIGTHALFSRDVVFKELRYVIIDEQQRFGVLQRIALLDKGNLPDLLLMTATPIPRTLALTVFGDLEISTIRTMPQGRSPVITHLAAERSRERVYRAVGIEFERGHQAYFVFPRIDDQGDSGLKDAEGMYVHLTRDVYPGIPAGLIHSRIPEEEKLSIMERFRDGELRYVVATSVVEVGVDVPNAACMVIDHAERFGLSALHQLRGRVGRGTVQSYAFLIYSDSLSPEGRERLMIMKETHDGFVIAERDLAMRGPGEVAGLRQSGFLRFRFADIMQDSDILAAARREVIELLQEDPGLLHIENHVCREVLERCPPFEEDLMEA